MIVLHDDNGGFTHLYLTQAARMVNERIVMDGDQISAAGIRAIWLKEHGANICVKSGDIYLHAGEDVRTGRAQNELAHYLKPSTVKKIGPLTRQLKRFAPGLFGIRKCPRLP